MRSRNALALVAFAAVLLPLVHVACTDDEPATPQAQVDAGGFDANVGADSTVSADGNVKTDTGSQAETGTPDAGQEAAVADTGVDAADLDGGVDAADASLGTGLYLHSTGNLYLLDPNDAGVTKIGATGTIDIRLVYDEGAGVMRGIARALTNPTLVTVDLCTAAVTEGPRIVKVDDAGADSGPLVRGECWGRRPDGTWWAGVDWNGDPPNAPKSESFASFDIVSGAVKRLAFPFTTTQGDCDNSVFVGNDFIVLDVSQPTTSGLYRIDIPDAAEHKLGTPPTSIVRIGYDQSTGKLYGFGDTHQVYDLDPTDAGVSLRGTWVDPDAGVPDSVAAAPIPQCP